MTRDRKEIASLNA